MLLNKQILITKNTYFSFIWHVVATGKLLDDAPDSVHTSQEVETTQVNGHFL